MFEFWHPNSDIYLDQLPTRFSGVDPNLILAGGDKGLGKFWEKFGINFLIFRHQVRGRRIT